MPPSLSTTDEDMVPTEELVFSCSICQATPFEVYAAAESNQDFQIGSSSSDGIVTKMWISSCSHVTCARHLKDGAAPFHPKNKAPRAPCPKCIKDHGDNSLKELYSIHGVTKGKYDPVIPDDWFQCPPVALDNDMPGTTALRFQYVALSHFAGQARNRWKAAQRRLSAMEKAYSHERKARRQGQADLMKLKDRVEKLEKSEKQLQKWEARKTLIEHYMEQVGVMAEEIRTLRGHLHNLGYEVPDHNYALDPHTAALKAGRSKPGPPSGIANHPAQTKDLQRASHRRPAQAPAIENTRPELENTSSAHKRKYYEDYGPQPAHENAAMESSDGRMSSRDLMPPPLPRPDVALPAPSRAGGELYRPVHERRTPNQLMPAGPPFRSLPQSEDWIRWPARTSMTRADQHAVVEQAQLQSVPLPNTLESRTNQQSEDCAPVTNTHFAIGPSQSAQQQEGAQVFQPFVEPPQLQDQIRYTDRPGDFGNGFQNSASRRGGRETLHNVVPHRLTTPSPKEPFKPTEVAASPYFKYASNIQSLTTRAPPMSSSSSQVQHAALAREAVNDFRMAPAPFARSSDSDVPVSLNGLSFIDQPRCAYDNQPLFKNQTTTAAQSYQPIQQSPRTFAPYKRLPGPSQQPNMLGSESSQSQAQHYAGLYPGRRTLPTYSRRNDNPGLQPDSVLSKIHGVRGVGSLRGPNAPTSALSRNIFSAAGSRRTVRR